MTDTSWVFWRTEQKSTGRWKTGVCLRAATSQVSPDINTVFSSIDGLYVDGTFKLAPKFFHQLFPIRGLTMCNLHFSYRPINIQRPMRMYSDIRYQRLQNVVWMFFQQLFILTSKPPFTRQWQQRGQAWNLKHVFSSYDRAGGGKYYL